MSETRPLRGPSPVPGPPKRPDKILVRLSVNGRDHEVAVRPYDVLLDTIRDGIGLTGTTRGCDMGTCGCCTVHVDGVPTLSCLTLTATVEGREIRTIENIAPLGTQLHPVQKAFHQQGGSQCGFCTPGFVMTATALLRKNPVPTEGDIRRAISGNMCRCTGYLKIIEAVQVAGREMAGGETEDAPGASNGHGHGNGHAGGGGNGGGGGS